MSMNGIRNASLGLAAIVLAAAVFTPKPANAADYKPFTGEKTIWHNAFDRYDFSMDDATGAITPMTAPANEVTGNSIDVALRNGKRRCVVVVPKEPAPGYPWSYCPRGGSPTPRSPPSPLASRSHRQPRSRPGQGRLVLA